MQNARISWVPELLVVFVLGGCAASQPQPTTPSERIQFEELRIIAKAKPDGGYDFDSYDAKDLFEHATRELNAQRCREAVPVYDKLVSEFPDSLYLSAALYNAGLCQQALGEFAGAADHYARVRTLRPDSEDVKDATFQLAEVLVQLERWNDVVTTADELLAKTELTAEERLEGMARRSQGLLGKGSLDEAQAYAKSALSYFRTRPPEQPIRDEFFAAACNYVLAETFRMRGEAMAFPEGLEPQKQVLVRRAELLLEAQREYFNTISFQNVDNLHWAAASGYRIGHMYDALWHAIMSAPVPASLKGAEAEAIYHKELAKLVKPLIRHAVRYFELTLMFIERTGMKTPWAEKTKLDLERVRELLLEQPEGPGGLPAADTSAQRQQPAADGGAGAGATTATQATEGQPSQDAPPREPARRGVEHKK